MIQYYMQDLPILNKTFHDYLLTLAKDNKPIFWDIKNYKELSTEALLERLINYGTFEDWKKIYRFSDKQILRQVYEKITTKRRVNLRPQFKAFWDSLLDIEN